MPGGWQHSNTGRTSTPEHRAWRHAVLTRDHHRCQIQGPGCTGTATEADHITEVADGGHSTLENGQAVCHTCHAAKTAKHANRKRWANRSGSYPTEKHPGLR